MKEEQYKYNNWNDIKADMTGTDFILFLAFFFLIGFSC